jgi:hypothetical protein
VSSKPIKEMVVPKAGSMEPPKKKTESTTYKKPETVSSIKPVTETVMGSDTAAGSIKKDVLSVKKSPVTKIQVTKREVSEDVDEPSKKKPKLTTAKEHDMETDKMEPVSLSDFIDTTHHLIPTKA